MGPLDRSDRRVRTTPAGAVLLARGRVLLAMADEAFAEVRAGDSASRA